MGDGFYRSKDPTNSIKVPIQSLWASQWTTSLSNRQTDVKIGWLQEKPDASQCMF